MELAGLLNCWNFPWCIGGNFNITRFTSERSGAAHLGSAMGEFSDFISEQGLMDLPLIGGAYNWSNSQDLPVWSKIDRFLVSPDFEFMFPSVSQKRLPCLCSDHLYILLDCRDV